VDDLSGSNALLTGAAGGCVAPAGATSGFAFSEAEIIRVSPSAIVDAKERASVSEERENR